MKTNLILFLLSLSVVATITTCVGGDGSPDNSGTAATSTLPRPTNSLQPAPTKTPDPNATATRSPKRVTFSIASAQRTVPEDVLREVDYSGGGAEMECRGDFEQPIIEYSSCSCQELEVESELGCTLSVYSCGWRPDELVRITLRFPDGRSVSETQRYETSEFADEWYGSPVYLYYRPSLNDPPGLYTFIFEGESGRVQHSFEISRPTGPRLHRDGDSLILYNFEPGERVRLFAYRWTGDGYYLEAWQEFRVDHSGQLIVQLQTDDEGCKYIVLGDVSGEHKFKGLGSIQKPLYLIAEGFAGSPCELYASYLPDYGNARQVASGTRMEVIGTEVDNGLRWWHVRLSDGTVGWVFETDVECVPMSSSASAQSSPTPGVQTIPTTSAHGEGSSECPGAPPQQVSVGDRAWVCTAYDRLVVRAGPRRSSPKVTCLEPGTYVTVVGGPTCADGWSWWKIRTDSGTVGWVAEGGDSVDPYFICPAR